MAFSEMGIEAVAKGIDSFEGSLDKMKRSIGEVGRAADNDTTYIGNFNAALGDLALVGFATACGIAVAGITAISGALTLAIKEASEAEKIWTKLGAALFATNDSMAQGTLMTVKMAQELAMQFRDLADGSDETIASIIDMAVRMGNITANELPTFIQRTLDLAAATGMDAVSAARLLAQAYEDPISALGRFRKLGIQFTDAEEKQIKTLMAVGKVAEANKIIMDRLGVATGGQAAAASATFSGQLETLKNHIGEVFEEIGNNLLPILTPLIGKFLEFIDRVGPPLINFFTNNIIPAVKTVVDWLTTLLSLDTSQLENMLPDWVVTLWEDLNTAWDGIVKAWNENLQPALDGLAKWWADNSEDIISAASGIAGELGKIASQAITEGMDLLAEAIKNITSWLTDHKQDIKDGLGAIEKFVVDHGDQIKDFFKVVAAISLAQLALDLVSVGVGLAGVAAPYIALGAVAIALATIYDVGEKAAKRNMTDEEWEKLAPSEKAVASIKASFEELGKAITVTADEGTLGGDLNKWGADQGANIGQGIVDGLVKKLWETDWGSAILTAIAAGGQAVSGEKDTAAFEPAFFASLSLSVLNGLITELEKTDWGKAILDSINKGFVTTAGGETVFDNTTFFSNLALNFATQFGTELSKIDWLGTITSFANLGAGIAGAIINAVVLDLINGATDYVELIGAALQYVWDQITNDFDDSAFQKIGAAIISGLIVGLNSKWADLKKKIDEIISSIPEWVKDMLGIASPSKVFEKIGKNMMLGLELGTDKGAENSTIQKTINSVVMPPVVSNSPMTRNQTVNNEKNILEGATINNNTGFDLGAFAETVRNA